MRHTADTCINCGICVDECRFLQEFGSPDIIAKAALASDLNHDIAAVSAYHCSTCSLCSAVCPVNANPAAMFEPLRSHAQKKTLFSLDSYEPLLSYEKLGGSFLFKDNILPNKCTTAFFPGCTLPAMFPKATQATYAALKQQDPSLGLILNCCSKPSKALGLSNSHSEAISELVNFIESKGIKKILTACPNCHITFKDYSPSFKVVSIYEELLDLNILANSPWLKKVTIHDPCVTRFESGVHKAVRQLLTKAGVNIVEMKHTKEKTICCGEGGAVGFHNSPYAQLWTEKRATEAEQVKVPMVTYCAGCANYLSKSSPVAHLLDLLFVKRNTTPKLPMFPFNYLNRLKLKITARLV